MAEISVTVPEELVREIEEYCERNKVDLDVFVRFFLRIGIGMMVRTEQTGGKCFLKDLT